MDEKFPIFYEAMFDDNHVTITIKEIDARKVKMTVFQDRTEFGALKKLKSKFEILESEFKGKIAIVKNVIDNFK